jgi:hypothetical protein
MKKLKEEAREYLNKIDSINPMWSESDEDIVDKFYDFALNSKWVQAGKINARIEILYQIRASVEDKFHIDGMIEFFEQQLKELED